MKQQLPGCSSGQALVEFLVVSAAMAIAVFCPFVQGRSVASLLMHALMEFFRAGSFLVSIL